MNERAAIQNLWQGAKQRGQAAQAALATVCEVKGSAYRRPGARMLLCSDGQSAGVINGGCLDADLWRRAREAMASGQAQCAVYDTTSSEDIVWGLGLGCRGVVKILIEPVADLDWLRDEVTVAVVFEGESLGTVVFEGESPETVVSPGTVVTPETVVLDAQSSTRSAGLEGASAVPESASAWIETFRSPPPLWVFGAGADAVPLVHLAESLGWNVQVIDPRAPHPERRPLLPSRYLPPERTAELPMSPRAACVLMTHNFLHDAGILRALLQSSAFYIGALGPKRRASEILDFLQKQGFVPTDEQRARFHAPIGLDIGAETPEEIALSIVAELRAVTTGRGGGFLRAREAAIHSEAGA